jgi:hypothetical protein
MGLRSTERESCWRGLIERQVASGLGVAAFCRQESLSAQNFYAWKRKLLRRDIPMEEASPEVPRRGPQHTGLQIVPVRIEPRSSSSWIRVYLPQGITVELTDQVSGANLAALLRNLREA